MRDKILEELFQRIRDRVDEIVRDARQDVTDRILSAAMGGPEIPDADARTREKRRAPKGTAMTLCDRVLTSRAPAGLPVNGIVNAAETDDEKQVEASSVRSHLRRYEKQGRYEERGGIWYLGPKHEGNKTPRDDAARDDLLGSTANAFKMGDT